MLTFRFETSPALERLGATAPKIHDALLRKIQDLAIELRSYIAEEKLSGQVLQSRSGVLRASIDYVVADEGARLSARVGSFGDVRYAAIQEFGGKTAAHDIVPKKAEALAFLMQGKQIFARRVHHPGSLIPERSYIRSALADKADEITAALTRAAITGLRGR